MDPITGAAISGGGSFLTGILGAQGSKYATRVAEQVAVRESKRYRQVRKLSKEYRAEQKTRAGKLYNRSLDRADEARDDNAMLARKLRDRGLDGFKTARDANLNTLRDGLSQGQDRLDDTLGRNLGDLKHARNANIGDLKHARDRAIGGFQPYADQGKNAMLAYASNLGLGKGPAGYSGLELSPGAKFLLGEGTKQVEGGAAGAGGLYSGETLAELERLRSGTVATDRDNQMAQLFGLAGMGQGAAGSIADLERGFAGDIAGQRDRYATGAGDERRFATTGKNALDLAYRPMITGARDQYATNAYNVGSNYTNQMTGINDTHADRGLQLDQQVYGNIAGADAMQLNAMIGAGSNINAAASAAGTAGAARMTGAQMLGQSINNGVNNAFQTYYQMGDPWWRPTQQQPQTAAPMARPA